MSTQEIISPEVCSVTEQALTKRINRKLSHKNERLVTARGQRAQSEVGRYYVVDEQTNTLVLHHVNLEKLAQELGVLGAGEEIVYV